MSSIRANGDQYTTPLHGPCWALRVGEGDKAVALFSMLNPINHALTRANVHRYKVEPYVAAADIYAARRAATPAELWLTSRPTVE